MGVHKYAMLGKSMFRSISGRYKQTRDTSLNGSYSFQSILFRKELYRGLRACIELLEGH
jgi:hypothetical protein